MNDNRFQVHSNSGQIVINHGSGRQQVIQNISQVSELDRLKNQLEKLIQELKNSDQLNEEEKQDNLEYIESVVNQIHEGTAKKGVLRKLNKELINMSGLVSTGSALGQCISAITDLIGAVTR
ncbi:hypothetical protein GXN76_09595 [Kroppenstedtia pulmonis]|uniref:Uncharacterized protein n=1 Tax=Kroppenstedtia pulmonis TaxID=1380685 RepID=A0A7D3Y0R9_9BACL|nr:hypothetical protein [Kroppenstedtia pulmonis]QKG84700.1 hypothetical protein GXN76_09595 [Kroppenstedtia pulmonis]